MKRILITLLLIIGLNSLVISADLFNVTDIGISAETIGIGNIQGFGNGAVSVFDNPAGLYRTKKYSISAFNTKLMDEADYTNFALSLETNIGYFGIGYMYAGANDIAHTEEVGGKYKIKEKFDYKNSISKLSYARKIMPKLYAGTSLVYYSNDNYNVKGSGINCDLGFLAQLPIITLSITGRNMLFFSSMDYNNTNAKENMPLEITGSAKFSTLIGFDIFAQLKKIEQKARYLKSIGLRYTPKLLKLVNISSGYQEEYVLNNVKGTASIGMGVNLYDVGINYAYKKNDYIQNNDEHYLSIKIDI